MLFLFFFENKEFQSQTAKFADNQILKLTNTCQVN